MARNTVMLNVCAECYKLAHYAECRHAERRYADCHGAVHTISSLCFGCLLLTFWPGKFSLY
jgi:hypothetical protein